MLESDSPKNEEYRKTRTGSLARSYELPSGINVQERIYPMSNTKIVTETYETMHRQYSIFGEAEDFNTRILQRGRQMEPNSVGFIDEARKSKILLYSSNTDHINIDLMDSQEMGHTSTGITEEVLVSLVYSKDGLHECRVKAEKTQCADTENVGDWVDPLSSLIEYYSEGFSSGLVEAAGRAHKMSYDKVVEEFGSEKQPLVQEADDMALRLIEKALGSLPAQDQMRARRILEAVYLRESLSRNLLKCIKDNKLNSVEEALSILGGEDKYVNFAVTEKLNILSKGLIPNYERFLKINQFGENGFIWEDTEMEETLMHGSKETVVQGREALYGSKIAVQDSTFIIDRNNSDINVSCLADNNKIRWISVFPLMIPFEEIKKVLNVPEEDFRKIRQLSTATLDLQR